jgi:hypothetical protein
MAVRKLSPKTRSNTTGGALKAQTPSPIAHRPSRLANPIEIWRHVGAALAASSAHKPSLDIGQPRQLGNPRKIGKGVSAQYARDRFTFGRPPYADAQYYEN